MTEAARYPAIGDYALISDCRSAALVSRHASIDWCCMPRLDHASCFGRLVGWQRGGYCAISPIDGDVSTTRSYLEGTLVLETRFTASSGEARLLDCFAIEGDGASGCRLLRVVEATRGYMEFDLRVVPRFDYGELAPWLRYHGASLFSAIGGDDALIIAADAELAADQHELSGRFSVRERARMRLSIAFVEPEALDGTIPDRQDPAELDAALQATIEWWRRWSSQGQINGPDSSAVRRSALVLRALANPVTGAIAAAPTTSLPEAPGGALNWDYRYSWIRDSAFSVHSLSEIGFTKEADAFRGFVERSAAGNAEGLRIMYGIGGARRLTEITLDGLEGYRGACPVRVGNAASNQVQLDVYGELVGLAWRWHERGRAPDDDYWRFLVEVINVAARKWPNPDRGIWEIRGEPRHFVHSKVMCWSALDRGLRLAEESLRQAPLDFWHKERDKVRCAVERDGYDEHRGVFVQAFGERGLDASLLLLPSVGFVDWDDERMVRTVDAVREDLSVDGLLLRYKPTRQLQGAKAQSEGAFLACTFWLAECLARQGRHDDAREVFDRCSACGNDLGLFSEEYDARNREMLGNFPQALTHLAHISAAAALAQRDTGVEAITEP